MDDPRWLDRREQEAWRRLVAVLLRLPSAIEQQLHREAGLTHIEYLVLALLSEADGWRLRLSHLAGQASVSLSRLSHVVTRMERRAWVRREPDPADGRATLAVLTDAGHAQVVAAAPGHVALVREVVFDALEREEVEALAVSCDAILGRLDREPQARRAPAVADGDAAHQGPEPERPVEVEGEVRAADGSSRAVAREGRHVTSVAERLVGSQPQPQGEDEAGVQEAGDRSSWAAGQRSRRTDAPGAPERAAQRPAQGPHPRAAWAAEVATHRVVRGRRWRVSDPRIPGALRERLVDELLAARHAVRDAPDVAAERAARDRVEDAKVALGERGLRWWAAELDRAAVADRIRRAHRALARTEGDHDAATVAAVVSRPEAEVAEVLR